MLEVHVLATITPAPGKEARLKELLTELSKNVETNEKDVAKHQFFEYTKDGQSLIFVEEIYKTQATLDAHFKMEIFQEGAKKFEEEGLVAAPLDIKTIKPFAGFAARWMI